MNLWGDNKKALSDFKDPFKKDCVDDITFWIRKDMWDDTKTKYSASVCFTNGNTSGKQSIVADNFVDLVKKTEEFVKSL